jgi:hypothetical protein
MGLDRSTWLISGIAFAAIGFTGAMVLYATVSHNSPWEWDISLALLVLGFAGVALGVVVAMGWGPFAQVGVNTAGRADENSGEGRRAAVQTKDAIQGDHFDDDGLRGRG